MFGVVEKYSMYEIIGVIVLNESRVDVPMKPGRAAVEYYAGGGGCDTSAWSDESIVVFSNRWKC